MRQISVEQISKITGGALLAGNPDLMVENVIIDSREEAKNALFVPIVGEKTDGHKYVTGAINSGAVALFMKQDSDYREEILAICTERHVAVIAVEDTIAALQKTAGWYRAQFQIPVIGITGSVGKTTTKEMIAAALETEKKVLKTIGNKNSQIGLSLMMFYLEDCYDIAVIEMGMSEVGEMANLARVAKPECAVMTNIGVAHIAQLGSKENIRKEKLSIVNEFVQDSLLFVNGNDTLLNETATQITQKNIKMDCNKETLSVLPKIQAVTYGIGKGFDYCATKITTDTLGTSFVLVYTENGEKKELPMRLRVYGDHNVMNALAAVAVAKKYGVSPVRASEGLAMYEPIAMRGQIKEVNKVTWIDDTYNASPDSMRSGIQVLLSLDGNRRIAVLADVLELGEQAEKLHREVGAYAAAYEKDGKKVDMLLTVGENATYIAKEADKCGLHSVCTFVSNNEVIAFLKDELKAGDVVLVKGSRGMKTDEIVKAFS